MRYDLTVVQCFARPLAMDRPASEGGEGGEGGEGREGGESGEGREGREGGEGGVRKNAPKASGYD